MKYKIGDRVRIIKDDPNWIFWIPEMNTLIGQVHTIVGEWESSIGIYPTIIIPGYNHGLWGGQRKDGEYAFPEFVLEPEVKVGDQLLFPFMSDSTEPT